ncbi:hypothetical protein JTE90_019746 [Oedothorax gibbosus]|uniref:Uncharacterized protein n=1 Tax=Oedothorax gibbosus TaxID=931172 RepID=A0AAV6UP49_9ARAC|nr:hypothetical protein JTE90_019746 [Oedothorax gibbosus]
MMYARLEQKSDHECLPVSSSLVSPENLTRPGAEVNSVDISGYDNTAKHCDLKWGSEYTVSIKFTANKPTDTLQVCIGILHLKM